MPIDGCTHRFADLTGRVLPNHMRKLRAAMAKPTPMATFHGLKQGVKACCRRIGKEADFSGCYVLLDHGKPIYVGISRGVVGRLIQHVRGRTHFDASLAYRIAVREWPRKMPRGEAMRDPDFRAKFDLAQTRIRGFDVAFVEIECSVELYAFELYCAMELDTTDWNTFRTH
ncbi:MAG TPA: hypothetical protein VK324_02140 [Tepidisphaeraceae bacterium]|nr:hypothetical protein [Tepidisphaeraceae bacterium]